MKRNILILSYRDSKDQTHLIKYPDANFDLKGFHDRFGLLCKKLLDHFMLHKINHITIVNVEKDLPFEGELGFSEDVF